MPFWHRLFAFLSACCGRTAAHRIPYLIRGSPHVANTDSPFNGLREQALRLNPLLRLLAILALVLGLAGALVWRFWSRPTNVPTPVVLPVTGPPSALPSAKTSTSVARPTFEDVALDSGLDFTYFNDEVPHRYYLPEVMGGGAAWFDFDGDGLLDLFLTNGRQLVGTDSLANAHVSRLWRNRGQGHFEQVTLAASAAHHAYGHGVSVGDFNADGFADLYLANFGADALLQNNGDGTFEEVTAAAGMQDDLWGFGSVWFDADSDEDLDLFVINYLDWNFSNTKTCQLDDVEIYCGPSEYQAQRSLLYVNRGDGTFVEAAEEFGFVAPEGKSLALAAVDLDDDLQAEIYVANDMAPNFLFTRSSPPQAATLPGGQNPGRQGRFREIAAPSGCAVDGEGFFEASMGIACGDLDRDGLPDLYLAHFHQRKNTVYKNLGELLFEDASKWTRIAQITHEFLGFGTAAFDYDRDGWLDLITTNGHVFGPDYPVREMTPQLLRNDGTGRFDDVTDQAGRYFGSAWLGRGLAAADYDNDGDTDFAITHLRQPMALLRNDTVAPGSYLGLELQTMNRVPPVGGRVVVKTGKLDVVTPIVAGGTYLSTNDARLLIGLGNVSGPVAVEVHWPGASRRVDSLTLEVNRYWLLVEGQQAEPCPAP